MPKWEYLEFERGPGLLGIGPSNKVDLRWLGRRFPKCKIETAPKGWGGQHCVRVAFANDDWYGAYDAIMDYLGTEGWEAFAADDYKIYFKRPLPEAT